jgi:hypothetical protein
MRTKNLRLMKCIFPKCIPELPQLEKHS